MPRGIIIFGSAGAGKTTLGKMVAQQLKYPYFDIDDYIWRKDTNTPFTVMYSREEKASRLLEAISKHKHFVMAGSMDSFNAPFVPMFDLAVHITAASEVRMARIHERELEIFGDRILKNGDMFEEHQRFLDSASRYETDGSPCLKTHLEWAATLPCKVLYLNGEDELNINVGLVVEAYMHSINSR
ncbi:MAG: AAA family ATPase [Christensenellaceae bacterium]|nr:AAA family ATPase [Christensenellaceae bacterium]